MSNASLPLPEVVQAATVHRQLHGLDARDGRNLLEYWMRVQREELRGHPIEIPDKLISFLQGHPLAIKIAARLCTTYTPSSSSVTCRSSRSCARPSSRFCWIGLS